MSAHPIESKVTASATTAAAVTVVLYLLHLIHFIAAMPDLVKGALGVLVAGAVTFAGGYLSPHTRRPDLPAPVEPGPITDGG